MVEGGREARWRPPDRVAPPRVGGGRGEGRPGAEGCGAEREGNPPQLPLPTMSVHYAGVYLGKEAALSRPLPGAGGRGRGPGPSVSWRGPGSREGATKRLRGLFLVWMTSLEPPEHQGWSPTGGGPTASPRPHP